MMASYGGGVTISPNYTMTDVIHGIKPDSAYGGSGIINALADRATGRTQPTADAFGAGGLNFQTGILGTVPGSQQPTEAARLRTTAPVLSGGNSSQGILQMIVPGYNALGGKQSLLGG